MTDVFHVFFNVESENDVKVAPLHRAILENRLYRVFCGKLPFLREKCSSSETLSEIEGNGNDFRIHR